MKYTVRGENIKVTPAIKERIEDKLSKFDRYLVNKDEVEAKIVVKVRGINQTIEVTIPTNKYTLRAEETHEDLYAAIDLVLDKLEKQYRKNKTKLQDRYKKEEAFFKFDDKTEKEDDHQIIKRKLVEAKPMDEKEAILQMELLNHDFFIFNNYKEESASVVYKRKDGEYGIITLE